MTPQELKNSILQLAIQGKLVEQRPEEGTAEELYLQIREEKRRLIQEKKLKKESPCLKLRRVRCRSRFRKAGSGYMSAIFFYTIQAKHRIPPNQPMA